MIGKKKSLKEKDDAFYLYCYLFQQDIGNWWENSNLMMGNVNNPVKESFYGKRKKNNALTVFFHFLSGPP